MRGEGELPHYLLMRCASEMKKGKGRSSLGSALTGCYSTLLYSAEGKQVQSKLENSPVGQMYLDQLLSMVDPSQDDRHPKVSVVVRSVIDAWHAGEKSLIFCFRTNTAERLREIIDAEIRKELSKRRELCLGGEESLKALRTRLTAKDRDLIVLGLDRVLWSFLWASRSGALELVGGWDACPYEADDLRLKASDIKALSELALRFGVDLSGERVDRVFLHRAIENVIAKRLLKTQGLAASWHRLLEALADEIWVDTPYGEEAHAEQEEGGEESASFDERGVHARYEEVGDEIANADVTKLAEVIKKRRRRAQRGKGISIFDVYAEGPSLWLGSMPIKQASKRYRVAKAHKQATEAIQRIHSHLAVLTVTESGFDWETRRLLLQALRRALLRESILLRLLPDRADRQEGQWGELLTRTFNEPLPGQGESMADRVAVFLEDVQAASGEVTEIGSARHALFEATRLRDQQFVALVKGGGDPATRERIFAGFNTPLLPEVLICTSVGQEGIDLHRHCRHVIHYDLAWNPAVLEQRTGRIDRIGSKTFRERAESGPNGQVMLEIGVPFLAGTYDERMYEELRLRAQTFEVLTGGTITADNVEIKPEEDESEGKENDFHFVPLPDQMVDDMRVSLAVWREVVVRD